MARCTRLRRSVWTELRTGAAYCLSHAPAPPWLQANERMEHTSTHAHTGEQLCGRASAPARVTSDTGNEHNAPHRVAELRCGSAGCFVPAPLHPRA